MASSSPISVLRKSGSSTCLQPRSDSGELPQTPSSTNLFTIVHTEELPHYSAERYYMLSELQLKAHSISFLSEWDAGENYHNNQNAATDESHTTQEMSYSSWGGNDLIDTVVEKRIRGGASDGKESDDSRTSNNSVDSNADNDDGENVGEDGIQDEGQQRRQRHDSGLNLPPCVILYLLWRYDSPHAESPELFARHYIRPCVQRILDAYGCTESSINIDSSSTREASPQPLSPSSMGGEGSSGDDGGEDAMALIRDKNHESVPHIYIVIDRICSGPPLPVHSFMNPELCAEDEQQQKEDHNELQLSLTKELMQLVATSQTLKLRSIVEGITVGVSTDVRAAPGLEQCMNAIMVGDAERRLMLERDGTSKGGCTLFTGGKWTMDDPQCSCIAIIADHPDDLVGLDSTMEADAAQGMALHLRMYAEWCGGGNSLNFASRSQKLWRSCLLKGRGEGTLATSDGPFNELDQLFTDKCSIMSHRRRRQQRRKAKSSCSRDKKKYGDELSNIMVAIFLAFTYAQVWKHYGEDIKDAVLFVHNLILGTKGGLGF